MSRTKGSAGFYGVLRGSTGFCGVLRVLRGSAQELPGCYRGRGPKEVSNGWPLQTKQVEQATAHEEYLKDDRATH
jgi:hypothetical protein